jgi:hypothetical protein
MKRISRLGIALVLVFGFAAVTLTSVFAITVNPIVWNDPTATNNMSGGTFIDAVLNPPSLPGTVNDSADKILPAGFPTDQAQFGGNGIMVSGLTGGDTVKICFDFPVYQYSWAGKIYEWNGTKWVAMPTTIVPPTGEGASATACTPRAGNGTYSLIIGFWGTPEAPLL